MPLVKPPQPIVDPVTKSVANPNAFAKPGVASQGRGTRFRPLQAKRPPGRPRKHKKDPRDVTFY